MNVAMIVCETERLVLSRLNADDADFVLELVNEPDWLRYIGDKNVSSVEDARDYIRTGPGQMYIDFGFGLYRVQLKEDGESIGVCGLLKRSELKDVDLGFAFLSRYRGKGYAFEAASATVSMARDELDIKRLVAMTKPDNIRSIGLLQKLGYRFERLLRLSPNEDAVNLYALETDS